MPNYEVELRVAKTVLVIDAKDRKEALQFAEDDADMISDEADITEITDQAYLDNLRRTADVVSQPDEAGGRD